MSQATEEPLGFWVISPSSPSQADQSEARAEYWPIASPILEPQAVEFVTRAALREREYSAVMAATGLLYLAILTAFGMDLVARVLLSP